MAFQVVEGPESERTAWLLHGILGSGRNWRSFARMLRKRDPSWRYVLPDLRNHGQTGVLPGRDDLHGCVHDLEALPAPDRVIGHSFGGKVALQWAQTVGDADDVWVLDSIPVSQENTADAEVLGVLDALFGIDTPVSDRSILREGLTQAGLSRMLTDWLLTSARRDADGWRWVYDLDGVAAMMRSYFETDFGPWLAVHDTDTEIHLVRAMDSDRWTADVLERLSCGPAVTLHELENAGHWLHVDNPEGLVGLLLG